MEKLNKVIASSGYCSTKDAIKLIESGEVTVNNEVVTDYLMEINDKDIVRIYGEKLRKTKNLVYYMLNKPTGYISQTKVDKNKKTVLDLVENIDGLLPVGRLESDCSGLLLLSNDKEFIDSLQNPKEPLEKEYKVKVQGLLRKEESKVLLKGIEFPEYKTAPLKIIDCEYNDDKTSTILNVKIRETKNREIKRMFEYINHPVKSLKRTRIGNLYLDVENGRYRKLKPHEVKLLKLLALGKIEK